MREFTKEDVRKFFEDVAEQKARELTLSKVMTEALWKDVKEHPEYWFWNIEVIEGDPDPTPGEHKP